jgi:hypothetical protein
MLIVKKIGDLSIPGSQWQLADQTSLDVLEDEDSWVKEAIAHPNYAPDGLPIISLPYLILMKLSASRTQDLADISRMLGLAQEKELVQIREVIKTYLPTAQEDLESLIVLGKLELGNQIKGDRNGYLNSVKNYSIIDIVNKQG